ncbi:MAG: peptidase S9, partial [Acidobacteria bacterium]|nr:peptidase S9 [Acidobacteriota bacterium]
VAWLSGFMGQPYRLPTVREARRLAKKAGDSGNTLDRWAGYPPNPEDVAGIEKVLANLGRNVPLLLPVGSLTGAGEDPVFDLDGNAGEWAIDDQGKGQAVGPSADRPIDPRHQHSPPGPAYTGFRVILGLRDHSHLTE